MTTKPKYQRKKLLAQDKAAIGRVARALTVSFFPKHMDILKARERELGVHRSILIQLLLEVELRDDLLRKELQARLQPQTNPGAPTPTTQQTHDSHQSNCLAHRRD